MFGAILITTGFVLLILGWAVVKPLKKRQRRQQVASQPFPEDWEAMLKERFLLDAWLPDDLRSRLRQHIQIFLDEKHFEPCGDLDVVTDEMRILVAAQACLLLIGLKKHDYFPKLKSILIYPQAFRDRGDRRFGLPEEDDDKRVLLGESWHSGSVILSWKSVKRGAANDDDGMNVVFHEFAHQLDQADGAADGVPILNRGEDYKDWAEVLRRDYEKLVEESNDPRSDPLIDPYGAENPAEFFAVATETFFEESRALRDEHPELYRKLRDYYGLDPAAWTKRKNR